MVYSLSRLPRSVKDTLAIVEQLERASCNLASITERIDTVSALGKMVFRLLSTLNEFEKDQLSERTFTAMAHLRSSGKRISSRLPLGWDLSPDGETLVPHPAEQQTVATICALRQQGKSMAAIALELDAARIPTKMGRAKWNGASIRSILQRQQRAA